MLCSCKLLGSLALSAFRSTVYLKTQVCCLAPVIDTDAVWHSMLACWWVSTLHNNIDNRRCPIKPPGRAPGFEDNFCSGQAVKLQGDLIHCGPKNTFVGKQLFGTLPPLSGSEQLISHPLTYVFSIWYSDIFIVWLSRHSTNGNARQLLTCPVCPSPYVEAVAGSVLQAVPDTESDIAHQGQQGMRWIMHSHFQAEHHPKREEHCKPFSHMIHF